MIAGFINRAPLIGAVVLALGAGSVVVGQSRTALPPVRSPKATAPFDLTGYWVSVVNKDWRFRMVIPAKGDFFGVIGGIPINPEARRIAEAWDPAKDEASGEACRAFGAAHLMQIPGRLHITWQNDTTLRVETDAGMQTRLFHFDAAPSPRGGPSWQGNSAAKWATGSLEVVTKNLRPGYLRRNGVPYSAGTSMTEYWDLLNEPDGSDWLIITTTIVDPTYLRMPYETSPVFKRERDGSKWDPSPCSARW